MKKTICLILALVLAATFLTGCGGNNKAVVNGEIKAGNIVTFGSYEQDNDASNGAEPIEWIVIDVFNGAAQLISKYVLDGVAYGEANADADDYLIPVTWETSLMRAWLNGEFLNTAFTASEQVAIRMSHNLTKDNDEYGTSGGNDTDDKIYLLSAGDAERVFPEKEDRKCVPTAYALAKGIYTKTEEKDGKATCGWFLRTPGAGPIVAAYVLRDGSIDISGAFVTWKDVGVRPVLWVNID